MVDRPSSASHRIDDEVSETRRATVRAMEDILYQSFDVLDHGFLRVIDYMGDDGAVVQAARVSYGKGTKAIQEDRGLIRYLMKHWHTTPFEMCEIKLHIKLPIFVARQWVRHRTANINEYSARYSIIDKEFYIPLPENLAAQSKLNRQGREVILGAEEAQEVIRLLRSDAERSYQHYRWMLNEDDAGQRIDPNRLGLTRELARMGLSINMYTQWYWKTDLHNLLRFLRLRSDAHAQYEIRVYADQLLKIVERWVPMTYEAFMEYQMKAVTLSATSVGLMRRMLQGEQITFEESGLSKREWDELVYNFHLRASDS